MVLFTALMTIFFNLFFVRMPLHIKSLILFFFIYGYAVSQNSRSDLKLYITEDDTGNPVSYCRISLRSGSIGITTVSNEQGAHEVLGINPGTWTVEIRKIGYQTKALKKEIKGGLNE